MAVKGHHPYDLMPFLRMSQWQLKLSYIIQYFFVNTDESGKEFMADCQGFYLISLADFF